MKGSQLLLARKKSKLEAKSKQFFPIASQMQSFEDS